MNDSQGITRKATPALTLAALGVVFGDIGTSPLYALRECLLHVGSVSVTASNILGILSLIFWSLMVLVTGKYLLFVMQAHNRGEGGVLALMALTLPSPQTQKTRSVAFLSLVGILGAALLFGDGTITPAISVLSAVEGVKYATPVFEPYVVPITVAILTLLFAFQYKGTGRIGALFGPIIFIWFLTLGILGLRMIVRHPEIIEALNPYYAFVFCSSHGWGTFTVLGGVFLAVTGAEALYADMGHFGLKPIRTAWFWVVFPGLMLNYFGQGALLLVDPSAIENPFYRLAPEGFRLPLVILATLATVIASQALISGAFSLTSQAIKLGLLPRITISHTSRDERGQIYISRVNWILFVLTVWLVIEFRSSSALASAYGIAVSLTMAITSVLIYFVARNSWGWSFIRAFVITGVILAIEAAFLSANLLKLFEGGWVALVIACAVFVLMTTWRSGRIILRQRLQEKLPPFEIFVHDIPEMTPVRVPGLAIYMSTHRDITPPALLYNLKHNKVIHETILVVSVQIQEVPFVSPVSRIETHTVGPDIHYVDLYFGFMEIPDVPRALGLAKCQGLELDLRTATYFLGRESLLATSRPGMAMWREQLFSFMSRNAQKASRFFRIKADQVVEIGFEVEL